MITEFPLFDGGRACFIDRPDVKLDFDGVGSLVNYTPSLKRKVLAVVEEKLAHSMVLPHRFGLQLNPKADVFDITHPGLEGILWLDIWKAEDLPAADWYISAAASSDPYLEVCFGAMRFTSPTVCNTLCPIFEYKVPLMVSLAQVQSVSITLWDEDAFKSDDFLGKRAFLVKDMIKWAVKHKPFELHNEAGEETGKNGRLWLRAAWKPLKSDPSPPPAHSFAVVFVGVHSAQSVRRAGNTSTSFRVQVRCTELLEFNCQPMEPQETMAYLPPKMEESRLGQGELLQAKIQILRKRGVPDEDVARVLDISPEALWDVGADAVASDFSRLIATAGRCDITWQEGFTFLARSPGSAKVAFTLLSTDLDVQEEQTVGNVEVQVSDVLQDSAVEGGVRSVKSVLKLNGTDIHLDVRMTLGFFGPSDDD
eukprot:CAMPEP_0179031882 /NCGR_PEP_ID=MMETSP0796-20121207/11296_1 /TAXON_ID=73915 /ORGANISM="Pyrodinium bahamense, Strain pbaha01" /LENGTH=422 /DNA_ID=CAMNT_0020728081 /DNA_START=97 /DNA_END=1365 /DNA_ORIENTATION=-